MTAPSPGCAEPETERDLHTLLVVKRQVKRAFYTSKKLILSIQPSTCQKKFTQASVDFFVKTHYTN